MPGANTLTYLASSSATKKKSFITLTPDGQSYENFSPKSLTNRPTKLERLSLGSYFIFVRKAGPIPMEDVSGALL